MRQTALALVNDILSAGEEEVVSTIGETEASGTALRILNRAYNRVLASIDWEHRYIITRLDTATGSTATWSTATYPALPWVMKLPANVESVYHVYYNQKKLTYIDKAAFQKRHINDIGLKTTGDPKYWTSWDDQYLVFDNYDSATEAQLSSANSEIMVVKFPGSDLASDTDQPDMPDRFYSAMLNKALQYYFTDQDNNITKAALYRSEHDTDLVLLRKWAKRNKGFTPYYAYFDFSKQWPGAALIRPDLNITDLGPA
jgi:hypothetical protein